MSEGRAGALERCIEEALQRLAPTPRRDDIERGVVLPVLLALGWDVFDTREVAPRFPAGKAGVDLALCDVATGRPRCLIELHGAKLAGDAIETTLSRGRREQVPLVVLTNGAEWRFFIAEADADAERPVFELDARAGDGAEMLARYLDREAVLSGASLKVALSIHALAGAWRALVSRGDSLLVELISDEVRDVAGVSADRQDILRFLQQLTPADSTRNSRAPDARRSFAPQAGARRHARGTLIVCGKSYDYSSAKEALVTALSELHLRDPTFLDRCARHPEFRKRVNRVLGKSTADLYPKSPHLEEHHAVLADGWLLATNTNNHTKLKQLRAATEVAGLEFGVDVIGDFGETGA